MMQKIPVEKAALKELERDGWKHEIFSVMLERGLEPDGLVRIRDQCPIEAVTHGCEVTPLCFARNTIAPRATS